MPVIQLDRVNRFLLCKQHLAPQTRGDDVLSVVQDICALHATGAPNPYLSLWSRLRRFQRQQLDTELYQTRRLVRRMCMRATVHIIPSAHLPVFFQATRQRLERRFQRDMSRALVWAGICGEGEQAQTLEGLQQRIVTAVAARGSATMAELGESVPELKARFEYAPGKAYGGQFSIGTRLISGLCVRGLLVRARPRGSWRSNLHQYALLPSWLPDVDLNATTPDVAQAELVRWYLDALGPATFEDIAWWSGFTKRETKKALSSLSGELVEVEIEGLPGDHLMLAVDQQRLEALERSSEPNVNLLPSLDPYIMGYRDRRRFLDPEHYDQVFDRAGNPFATVWTNGSIVGVWQQREHIMELLVWDDAQQDALHAEAERLGRFLWASQPNQPPGPTAIQAVIRPYPPGMYVRNPFALTER